MKNIFFLLLVLILFSCNATKTVLPIGEEIVVSKNLKILPITDNVFIHITYIDVPNYGLFPCNGMIYKNKNSAFVFDTPTSDEVAEELIKWLENDQQLTIKGVVINHFHEDCLGGLKAFHDKNIPSYAYQETQILAKEDGVIAPKHTFNTEQTIKMGNQKIINRYFGEGHTKDNIVSWLPSEEVLFGGCMVKSLKAGKGNLADATVKEWSNTVQKVKDAYPNVKLVIPGHGKYGDVALLDYTIEKFEVESD